MHNKIIKKLSLLTLCTILSATSTISTTANAYSDKEIFQDTNYYWEEILTIEPNEITTFATRSAGITKTATKIFNYKNNSGKIIATYKLTGTFTYGTGAPAKCTSAKYSTSTSRSDISFTAKAAYASGNQAVGTFTLSPANSSPISKTIKITCSVNGDIS